MLKLRHLYLFSTLSFTGAREANDLDFILSNDSLSDYSCEQEEKPLPFCRKRQHNNEQETERGTGSLFFEKPKRRKTSSFWKRKLTDLRAERIKALIEAIDNNDALKKEFQGLRNEFCNNPLLEMDNFIREWLAQTQLKPKGFCSLIDQNYLKEYIYLYPEHSKFLPILHAIRSRSRQLNDTIVGKTPKKDTRKRVAKLTDNITAALNDLITAMLRDKELREYLALSPTQRLTTKPTAVENFVNNWIEEQSISLNRFGYYVGNKILEEYTQAHPNKAKHLSALHEIRIIARRLLATKKKTNKQQATSSITPRASQKQSQPERKQKIIEIIINEFLKLSKKELKLLAEEAKPRAHRPMTQRMIVNILKGSQLKPATLRRRLQGTAFYRALHAAFQENDLSKYSCCIDTLMKTAVHKAVRGLPSFKSQQDSSQAPILDSPFDLPKSPTMSPSSMSISELNAMIDSYLSLLFSGNIEAAFHQTIMAKSVLSSVEGSETKESCRQQFVAYLKETFISTLKTLEQEELPPEAARVGISERKQVASSAFQALKSKKFFTATIVINFLNAKSQKEVIIPLLKEKGMEAWINVLTDIKKEALSYKEKHTLEPKTFSEQMTSYFTECLMEIISSKTEEQLNLLEREILQRTNRVMTETIRKELLVRPFITNERIFSQLKSQPSRGAIEQILSEHKRSHIGIYLDSIAKQAEARHTELLRKRRRYDITFPSLH